MKMMSKFSFAFSNFPNHGGSALDLPEELVPHLSSIFVKTPEKYHYGTRYLS